ncbi:hypothetical protein [Undibacterium umbellatum]|uniref:Uncharacterized protein n=1 Tax=Undibacterium umbellatum TaxID=2762300 RepID=A0ABR6ZB19_9BURK|nr:hypothetical protein [Undibacterium umbellatum]MBC3908545.1 hypothetical protein [Undibacterium umbellatum]
MKNGRQQDNSFQERDRQIRTHHAYNGSRHEGYGDNHEFDQNRDVRHASSNYTNDFGREQMQSRNSGSQGFYGVDGGRQQEPRYANDNGRTYPEQHDRQNVSQAGRYNGQQSSQDFHSSQANDGRYHPNDFGQYEHNGASSPRQYSSDRDGNNRGDSQQVTRGGYEDTRHGQHFDHDYHQWRNLQIEALDNDYDEWRKERYQKFSTEFDTWRNGRSANAAKNPQDKNVQNTASSAAASDSNTTSKSK